MWQDYVMAACSLGFSGALVRAVWRGEKVSRGLGTVTGALLLVLASTQLTLDLWWSAALNFLAGGLWLILARRSR